MGKQNREYLKDRATEFKGDQPNEGEREREETEELEESIRNIDNGRKDL